MEEEHLGRWGWEQAGIWGIQSKVIVEPQKTDPGKMRWMGTCWALDSRPQVGAALDPGH